MATEDNTTKREGMAISIPENEITERITVTEGIELIRYSEGIALHFGGMWLVSRPTESLNVRGGSLYETLDNLCELYSGKKQDADEDLKAFGTAAISTLLLPVELFSDAQYFIDIARYVLDRRTQLYNAIVRKAEEGSYPDPIGDAEFMATVRQAEQLADMLADAKDEKAQENGK